MIQLYGTPGSTCTRKVLTVLAETATPFQLNLVDLSKREQKQEAHLRRQPFGQIPAIDDDGFGVFESQAICRYLSAKAESSLTPNDLRRRAAMDQWLSVESANFSPAAMKFIYHYVFKRPQEPTVLEAANTMLDKTFAALSQPLERAPFLTGETFTLADVVYMPYLEYLMGTPAHETFAKHSLVVSWWSRVSERPSWRKVTGRA